MGELHVNEGAAAEVNAQRQRTARRRPAMAHRNESSHTENQGEGKEVPFLAQEIDIRIAEKFHLKPSLIGPSIHLAIFKTTAFTTDRRPGFPNCLSRDPIKRWPDR